MTEDAPAEQAHHIEELPLGERAAAYDSELERLRNALEGTDDELDLGA
ncbi:MAG: hypothetical protein ACTHXA_07990 [Gulosibacter sp.]